MILSLLLISSTLFSETTTTMEGQSIQGGVQLRFTVQRNTQVQRRTSFTSQPTAVTPIVQTTPRTVSNPSGGARTIAIESRGGEAATQVCGGLVEITNRSGVCHELEYDKDFLNFIQTEGLRCARQAGSEAFGFIPTAIKFRTLEGQVDGNRYSSNGKVSTHAVGRALDIFEVDIFNGKANNSVKMHKDYMSQRGHRVFYSSFGNCWKDAIGDVKGGLAGTCGSGCLDFNSNSAHHDHMHISLPPLNTNRSSYKINCT